MTEDLMARRFHNLAGSTSEGALGAASAAVSIVRGMSLLAERSLGAPVVDPGASVETEREAEAPYHVFLWNDPVTLMDVVVRVLKKIFGYGTEKAEMIMITAHLEGKAVVWTGERDRARQYCLRLGSHGLQATVARAR
ncbi:MAG: ATP-dependent Clp protease adaptor ClpS [Acidimicrobiales bacterium]